MISRTQLNDGQNFSEGEKKKHQACSTNSHKVSRWFLVTIIRAGERKMFLVQRDTRDILDNKFLIFG